MHDARRMGLCATPMTMGRDHGLECELEVGTMTKTVSKSQFKPKALAYLRDVERTGEALVITDHGRPVVRIEPHAPEDDVLATLRGCVVRYDDPTEPVGATDWEAVG